MPVYTETKTYRTKAHMGMIDVTDDFRAAVQNACRNTGMKSGTITGFTTGGVAGLTTLEFEPGMVYHDLKAAMDVFSPYRDENGRVIYYHHHDTWHDDNGSSHIKAALLSPFIVIRGAPLCFYGHKDIGKEMNNAINQWIFFPCVTIKGNSKER